MTGGLPEWSAQSGFDVRLCWGPVGVQALGPEVATIVVVDILRFTTALEVATRSGAGVVPVRWPHDPTHEPDAAEVADGAGRRGLSLSPATLRAVGAGERIVLPSANGSHCCALAAARGPAVVGGCLRNAAAVARWHLSHRTGPVGLVPCGERWPDGSLRPAVEDLIGAGAIVAALATLDEAVSLSPEAVAARAAYGAVAPDLHGALASSVSGRELSASGQQEDLAWAAEGDVSQCVPLLGADGVFRDGAVPRPGRA
jgi:2-phosphosulfolactate phosphatase